MTLFFNPQINVYDFDGNCSGRTYLCEVPTSRAADPLRYLVPAEIIEFARRFDGEKGTEEIIAEQAARYPASYDSDKLALLVSKYLIPKGFLVDNLRQFIPPAPKRHRFAYLYIKLTLVPAHALQRFTACLKPLFRPKILIALAPLFLLTQIIFFTTILRAHQLDFNTLSGIDILILMLITSALSLFHELGHASALAYYGSSGASIGWGLYINFCVLYTDLSEAWKLKRTERAIVDSGGIYFHLIALTILLGFIFLTGWRLLIYSFFFVDLQIISSLNPFLRADAFWLFSDLFGIPNLRQQSLGLLERVFYRIFHIHAKPVFPIMETSRRTNIILMVYTLSSMIFFIYLARLLLYQAIFKVLPGYPGQIENLFMFKFVPLHAAVVIHFIDVFIGVLWRSLGLFGLGFFLYRVVRGLVRIAKQILTHTQLSELANNRAPIAS